MPDVNPSCSKVAVAAVAQMAEDPVGAERVCVVGEAHAPLKYVVVGCCGEVEKEIACHCLHPVVGHSTLAGAEGLGHKAQNK